MGLSAASRAPNHGLDMANLNRKLIHRSKESFDIEDCSLEEILQITETMIKQYGKDAKVMMHSIPYDNAEYLYVFKEEPETDEQMNRRIAVEISYEEAAAERDRREYERLSLKFKDKK